MRLEECENIWIIGVRIYPAKRSDGSIGASGLAAIICLLLSRNRRGSSISGMVIFKISSEASSEEAYTGSTEDDMRETRIERNVR